MHILQNSVKTTPNQIYHKPKNSQFNLNCNGLYAMLSIYCVQRFQVLYGRTNWMAQKFVCPWYKILLNIHHYRYRTKQTIQPTNQADKKNLLYLYVYQSLHGQMLYNMLDKLMYIITPKPLNYFGSEAIYYSL